jgi:serine/threonine protein kinase
MEIQKGQAASSNLFDQLIDQYKLEAHVNQTAITDLYRAFDVDENRSVAVEILLPTYNNKKQFVKQFIDKMNKVASLKHPNIAQVHQIGTTPNKRPYFAREIVEGITLSERLAQLSRQSTPANAIYALKIVQQLAEALELAERLDLFHYHLAPENIMLKQDGTVVLVDLGIPAAENGTATKLASTLNTSYVAPEQLHGKPIDSRSQIFSLGIILYEILTGTLPENPSSFWRIFSQAIKPQNTALEHARPDLSQQTYNLIDVSLRKQTWGRYSSIKEFLEAINEALQNERMLIQTRGNTAVLNPPVPRRSRAVILLPLVAIALCIGSFAVWINLQNNNNAAVLPLAANTTIANTNTSTPIAVQSPTAVFTESATATTAVVITDPINILAPANAAEFQASEAVNFRWTWAALLQENQRFSVYLLTGSGHSLLGTVSTPATDGNYNLQTLLPASDNNAVFEWHVVLEDTATNQEITTSSNRQISINPAPTTPTFTPSPTTTATPTNTATPTPIPQIQITVSSASLRQGPSINYPILRFLFQGDVVAVLAKDSLEGEWYNVILDDGRRGWIAASVSRLLDEDSINIIPIAATIPPRPTNTPTATPTNTPTPTNTATPDPGDGNPQPTTPPTFTPPPPPPPGG